MGVIHRLKTIYLRRVKKVPHYIMLENHLREVGVTIGEDCLLLSNDIEGGETYLVTIGNNVTIAPNVSLMTHDDSVWRYYKKWYSIYGEIVIGDNCFIGEGAIIMPGVHIANNCVVGAGSIVTKSINEEGTIVAGNPARPIAKLEDLIEKNKDLFVNVEGMDFAAKKRFLLENKHKLKKI